MIPFWNFNTSRRPTKEENLRVFLIIGYLLLGVMIAYSVIALTVFGHL